MSGSIQRLDRPKPWRARYRGPDGKERSRVFARSPEGYTIITSEIGYVPLRESIVDDPAYLGGYPSQSTRGKPTASNTPLTSPALGSRSHLQTIPTATGATTNPPPRFIDVEGCLNFRDLGGYPTKSGRSVARNLLYRSDALHRLTPRGAEAFQTLAIQTVIDLRTADELASRPWTPPTQWKGRTQHVPLRPRNPGWSEWTPNDLASAEFALNHYRQTLLEGAPAIKSVVDVLATDDTLPAVFHCAAGKDPPASLPQ